MGLSNKSFYGRTDKELLDYLQTQLERGRYTGKVVCRWSKNGRGIRLHETSRPEAKKSIREAIADMIEKEIE